MGLMKDFLIEKVAEFADKIGKSEEEVYRDNDLYDAACKYADSCLKALKEKYENKTI